MIRPTQGQSGAAAVEMAILLPLLLIILAGVLDMGSAALVRARTEDAVGEGSMQAARVPSDPAAAVKRTVEASNGVLTSAEVWVVCPEGRDVQVVASHQHRLITGFLPLIPDPVTMRIESRIARLSPAACVATSPGPPAA
jgi:hypothetical protein